MRGRCCWRPAPASSGTNVFYKWQLPDGIQANAHDTRSYGSVIAEASGRTTSSDDKCQTADCSVMEFVLPSISQAQDSTSEPSSATEDGDFDGEDFLPKNDQWLSTSFSRAHESDRAAETTFLETARWNSNSVPEKASTTACLSR